jgi:hypothetical protein
VASLSGQDASREDSNTGDPRALRGRAYSFNDGDSTMFCSPSPFFYRSGCSNFLSASNLTKIIWMRFKLIRSLTLLANPR